MSSDNIINQESEHQELVCLARLCHWFTSSRDAYQPLHCYQGCIRHEHTLLNINIFKDSDVLKLRLLLANGFCSPWQKKSKASRLWSLSIFPNYCIVLLAHTHSFPAFCRIPTGHWSVSQSVHCAPSDANNLYWLSFHCSDQPGLHREKDAGT